MKQLSKSESILNDYIMNTSEISSSKNQAFTIQTINNNLSLRLQSRNSTIKKNPFSEFSFNINNISKLEINKNNLINSIESNDIEKIIEYLDKDISKINILNENGISALHIAVINGNLDIINILLKYGANPNITSLSKKQTPLHFAYIFKSSAFNQIINLLIKYNANPNLEDIDNKKPFEYALKYQESNEIDISSSNENEKKEKNIDNLEIDEKRKRKYNINEINNEDSYNEDNNLNNNNYTISDSEPTITQTETKSAYNIEELINWNKENENYNNRKIKIIGKNKNTILEYNKNSQNNLVSCKNDYNDTLNDSLEINIKDSIINNYYYNNNIKNNNKTSENSLNKLKSQKRKSFLYSSHKNLRFKKRIPLGITLGFNDNNTFNSETQNKKKYININDQYYINNEFFNNYFNNPDYIKSKAKRRSFKIPKVNETRSNSGFVTSSLSTHNQTNKKNNANIITNNDVTEFTYPEDYSIVNECENSKFLKNWLSSIELSAYYDNFINNNISDINKLIDEVKINHSKINYDYLENLLKIHKSGHIYRILCKLEVDAGFVENKICNFLVGLNMNTIENYSKKNRINSKITVYSQYNEFKNKCCNCCDIKKPLMEKKDLKTFLRKYQILHLYDNFFHNGFNLINYVILQMYTKFSINDNIVQKCLHIYKKKDRYLVLDALFSEVKEINIFFSTNIHNHCLFPKYENNDWSNSFCDESFNSENENTNNCIVI